MSHAEERAAWGVESEITGLKDAIVMQRDDQASRLRSVYPAIPADAESV